jgi:diacylglycerol kinase (ATP)
VNRLPTNADTVVIVNPAAGGGRAGRTEPAVAGYLAARGHRAEFLRSKDSGDVQRLAAQAAARGARFVVGLGGDGVFHHLIEGLLGTAAIAGFFPAGNGNDIAEALGIPKDPLRAAQSFLRAQPRSVDVVRVRFHDGRVAHFIGAGGMGLDAEAAELANTRFRRWPGVTRYLAGALWTFFREPPFALRAGMDGREWSGRAILVVVANGPCYGAGVRIAPQAKMDDGWLDVMLVREVAWTRLVEALPILLTTGNLRFEEVERFRVRRLRLETDRSVKVHGDGEVLGDVLGESPAEFEVLPGAVRVMAPQPR